MIKPVTISACLIVRNESLVLERCLSSLSGAVDDLAQVLQLPNEQLNPEVIANAAVRLAQLAMGDRRALIAYCASNKG